MQSAETLFSEMELWVLKLICNNYTTAEISRLIRIPKSTVEKLKERLMEKTKSKNEAGLVMYAFKNKFLSVTPTIK